ncbi:MAG: hypothetical protein ABIL62_17155, partial [Planctomycetota bacterium]
FKMFVLSCRAIVFLRAKCSHFHRTILTIAYPFQFRKSSRRSIDRCTSGYSSIFPSRLFVS